MKNLLPLLIILFALNASAQSNVYHPFPEDTATWITDNYASICSGYCGSNYYAMKGDTVINNQSYNKLYSRYGQFYYIIPPLFPNPGVVGANFSACSYAGAIRQDSISKRVYFIDSTLTTDTLLYDFNIAIGDTIQTWYTRVWVSDLLIVSAIDSVLIKGSYHKRFNFLNSTPGTNMSLIEGVGWTGDLLNGLLFSPDGAINLACFDGDFPGQQWLAFNNECSVSLDCSITIGLKEEVKYKSLPVFPNPFNDKLNFIMANNQPAVITIYDMAYRKLLQQEFMGVITLNTESFAKGMYLIEAVSKNGEMKTGVVVKD